MGRPRNLHRNGVWIFIAVCDKTSISSPVEASALSPPYHGIPALLCPYFLPPFLHQRVLCAARAGIFAYALIHPFLHILFGTLLGAFVDGLQTQSAYGHTDVMEDYLTGTLPLRADLALSVRLWPACPPAESPVLVSGTVESVEAMVVMRFA